MRERRVVIAAVLIFIAVYIVLDFNKLYALRYGADTGTFVQFLTNEAHGRGSWNNAEYRPHLQVHDSWALLALAPLMAIFPFAQTLLVVQIVAIAAASLVIFEFARVCGAQPKGAAIVAIAYLIAPCTQGIAYGNFLENAFVPLLAALLALAVARRSLAGSLIAAQVLLGIKEDQALFIAWFGAGCALWWDRRIGVAAMPLAAMNGIAFVLYEHLAGVHPSIPAYSWRVDDPLVKLSFFAALLAPFAFAPLWLRWRMLLAAPLVAELTFNRPWAYEIARIGTHWTASVLICAALATAYVVAKRPNLGTPVLVLSIVCALTINDTVLKIGRWPYIIDDNAYRAALSLRAASVPITIPRHLEGIYAVAASNPLLRLSKYKGGEPGYCPAYNTNAAEYFSALRIRNVPQGVRLCGGVLVNI